MVAIFVAGATGKQGGSTARALLAAGHTVHVYVRSRTSAASQALASAGAVLFEGDWDDGKDQDGASLRAALAGTRAAFFISWPSFSDADAEVRAAGRILAAARGTPSVRHVVYSTVHAMGLYGEDAPGLRRNAFLAGYFRSKAAGEEMVRGFADEGGGAGTQGAAARTYTILRPSEFMTNYIQPWADFQFPDLIKTGVWNTAFPPDFGMRLVDPEDVGRIAAEALLHPGAWAGRVVEITGEVLPLQEEFQLLGEFAGRELGVRTYERAEAETIAEQNPLVQSQLLRMDWGDGRETVAKDDLGLGLGFRLTSFREYLDANRAAVVDTYKNVPMNH
ncbi:uncharacterized protein JN550_006508 [Neoarthrinium moseri]|uniref:uncharacterized protein n=1 Tax=Neoarthrinium moseri TaxID=1658444 RepID=UPI001FDB08A5|nr:uncharacterized protein JN550_006508 [Neoarthrinium moseri]KAI1868020.1 hypothetical protein JN550_006508 [Neoarthrinium moseri]